MGNCFATTDMGRKFGGCVPFWGGGAGSPSNTCRGLSPCQVTCWSIQPFGHNRHGSKIGGLCPFGKGQLGPHLTQGGWGRGLPPCQVSSWSIQPFGHNTTMSQTNRTTYRTTIREHRVNRFTNGHPEVININSISYKLECVPIPNWWPPCQIWVAPSV